MVTMCSTARCVVRGTLLDLHMWTNGSMHGLGAKLARCGCRVQFSHIAASLSCCAKARTSCGQMSRRWICRPLRSVKTSKAGHSYPMRLAVRMHAPAGPVTLDHLFGFPSTWCKLTFCFCQYQASSSSCMSMAPSQMAAAHVIRGAASHSCCTSARCSESLNVVERPMCWPGKQLEIDLLKARTCDSDRPMALHPYNTDGLMPAMTTFWTFAPRFLRNCNLFVLVIMALILCDLVLAPQSRPRP